MNTEETFKLALFEGRQIRKAFHEGEWWFSIIDVVEVLVGGDRPRKYWNDLKKKLLAEGYFEVSEKIGQLKMVAPDGKQRMTDCATAETLFRVIQSIPSPKVEPLKRWLAKVGKELAKVWGQIATPLRIETEGGVQRVNCANTEGLFRIIQFFAGLPHD